MTDFVEDVMRVRVLTALVGISLALTGGCGGGETAGSAAADDYVYKVSIGVEPAAACEDPSCVIVKNLEWVAPDAGWWRKEVEDATGYWTTNVYANGRYMNANADQTSVRIGSTAFIGRLADGSIALPVVREAREPTVGETLEREFRGIQVTLTIEERITLEEAERLKLFDIPTDGVDVHRELAPGTPPTLPIRAYWFGPAVAGRSALMGVELRFSDEGGKVLNHMTMYELPSADGKTSAQPGQSPPAGEIQVVSQPVDGWLARTTIREVARRERVEITLANGGEALLYTPDADEGFIVVTKTTLVSVAGVPVGAARRLARELRPL